MIKATINGIGVRVPDGLTILEACNQQGIYVPTLCHDKDLVPTGSCRICVVEVKGARSLVASCTTPITESMEIHTESEKVVRARKDILRLILDNHPNDCLICSKAGECSLQDIAYRYDVSFREHDGQRRIFDVDTSNPYVFRDNNKCILCGKCVQTCASIHERSVLTFAQRGFETQIAADYNNTMGESSCVSCGRCITVCPVGALLDSRNQLKHRVWEMDKESVKCTVCEYGCDFQLLKKSGKVVAVRA